MNVITLTMDAPTAVQAGQLYRMRFDLDTQAMDKPSEEEGGDVTFSCVGVDAKKQPNRRGFVFAWEKPEDVVVESFTQNPTMLYAHDRYSLPLGRWEQIQISAKSVKLTGRIPGGPDYEDIRPIRARVRDGYLKAVSLGFYILAHEEVRDKAGALQYIKITSFELVECSVCPIGAHETAIIGQQDPALTGPKLAAFAQPAGSKWVSEAAETDGVAGTLFKLSLTDESSAPAIVPAPGDPAGDASAHAPDPRPLDALRAEMQTLRENITALQQALATLTPSAPAAPAAPDAPTAPSGAPAPAAPVQADVQAPDSGPTLQEALAPLIKTAVREALSTQEVRAYCKQQAANAAAQSIAAIAAANRERRKAYHAR